MSQSDWFDNQGNENEEINIASDVHEAESSEDIYNTPDVVGNTPVEEVLDAEVAESAPEEKIIEADAVVPYHNNPYSYTPYGGQMPQSSYQGNNTYNTYNSNPYNNNPYNNNPYGNIPYGGQSPQNGSQGNNAYNNNPYNDNPYNNNPYGNIPYGGQPAQGSNQYANNQYGSNQYANNQYGSNQYANNQYGNNQYGNGPYGNPPYGNNQYSPYAVPPKKNKTSLIIGIVITVIVLFLIAIFALVYKAMSLYAQDSSRTRSSREEYRFDYDEDDWKTERNQNDRNQDFDHDHDDWYDDYDYDDYDYDDWYDDYDDQYYYFHDDIRTDLSYSVDIEYYEYDTDYENVYIVVEYPVIEGANVPNLDMLNDTIQDEINYFTEYFEEEYEAYITDEYNYFDAYSVGYVTYMDEEKMSIAFTEYVYSDYFYEAYVYCINIDMEHGVILDNENILSIDDDFSVDFRKRSDIQNGEISDLTMMTDQEITNYFNSEDIIVCYTPMGMEIGFNFDDGWVTVTYEEYEQYLKVF